MTTTANPYQAPSSDVKQPGLGQTYQPKIFTPKGRIGRLRYLAYCLASYAFLLPALIVGILTGSTGTQEMGGITGILLIVGYIGMIISYFIFAKRRFNDMDKTGWMSLLMIIPLVNIFIGLWLMFGRGTDGDNQYGAAPNANPLSVKIFGLIFPVLFIVGGILAAIAIPAYQDYVERSQAYSTAE